MKKLREVIQHHLDILRPIAYDNSTKGVNNFYFVDASLLRGDYTNLFSNPMLKWHLETSQRNEDNSKNRGRRYIRRLVPLIDRPYLPEEIRLIKFVLNFQLGLGSEIMVTFVDDIDFLEKTFGVDNSVVVKRKLFIDILHPYDPDFPYDLQKVKSPSEVRDRYLSLEDLEESENSFLLRYNTHSFSSHRRKETRKLFEPLLYRLQRGKCAISGTPLDDYKTHIDHIYPIGEGGNNSLINLQLIKESENLNKKDKLSDLWVCLSPEEMKKYGFETTFHGRFNDRMLKGVSPGPPALYHQDPYARR